MSKKGVVVIEVIDYIYHHDFTLVVGSSKDFLGIIKTNHGIESVDTKSGKYLTLEIGNEIYRYIWCKELKTTMGLTVFAHEVLHHVLETMRSVGIEESRESEEAFTYYMQYCFGNALNDYRDKVIIKNKRSKDK